MENAQISIPWYTKWLVKLWPAMAMRVLAKKCGYDSKSSEKAQDLFLESKSIDLHPLPSSRGRGFSLIIDGKLALFFYQDGDHFAYDGFEMGEYNQGDIRIFDRLEVTTQMFKD